MDKIFCDLGLFLVGEKFIIFPISCIKLIDQENENLDLSVSKILSSKIIGFDSEYKWSSTKFDDQNKDIYLVQISTE